MNSVSASANLAPEAPQDEWDLNIDEPSPQKQTAIRQAGQWLTERTVTAGAEHDTPSELKHDQFGKMSESTSHWLTQRHPAFRLKRKPKNVATILGSEQLSSATNIWVVTEKVHGSNLSFVCFPPREPGAPATIRCAKREEFLNEDSDEDNTSFFGFRKVKNRYQAAAELAYATIAKQFVSNGITTATPSGDVVRLTIYGELFGGAFPGLPSPPDVNTPVQEGVYYHPDLDYMAFGATVMLRPPADQTSGKQADRAVTSVELDFLPAMEMLKSCGYFTAEALHTGSFTACCNFDINFTTTIPARLGVDPKARKKIATTNLAEGIVCRTNIVQMVPVTGNKPDDHCMFKRKRDDFASYCSANAQGIACEQNRSLVSSDKKSFLHCIDEMVRSRLVHDTLSKTGTPITKNQKTNKRLCERASELVLADVKEEVSSMTFSLPGGASGKKPVKAHKNGTRNTTVRGDHLLARYMDDIERIIADAVREKASK